MLGYANQFLNRLQPGLKETEQHVLRYLLFTISLTGNNRKCIADVIYERFGKCAHEMSWQAKLYDCWRILSSGSPWDRGTSCPSHQIGKVYPYTEDPSPLPGVKRHTVHVVQTFRSS